MHSLIIEKKIQKKILDIFNKKYILILKKKTSKNMINSNFWRIHRLHWEKNKYLFEQKDVKLPLNEKTVARFTTYHSGTIYKDVASRFSTESGIIMEFHPEFTNLSIFVFSG